MKRVESEHSLRTSKRPIPQHLSTPQQCLLDYLLDASLCEVHDFFKKGGTELLPFFDIYLHKSAYSHICEEERVLCRWYFLFSPTRMLEKDKQFLLLKQITECEYRFLFEMLLCNRMLFWQCSETNWMNRICRLSLCLNQLVELDCAWAIERVRCYAEEQWQEWSRCDLIHLVLIKPRTWRKEYPMRVFRVNRLNIFVQYPQHKPLQHLNTICNNQLNLLEKIRHSIPPALSMRESENCNEFTLANLIELHETAPDRCLPLLVAKFVCWFDQSNKTTHNYFRILDGFARHLGAKWDEQLFWFLVREMFYVFSFGLQPTGDYHFFRGLSWYFNRHSPSAETRQELSALFSRLPEFLFVSDRSNEPLTIAESCYQQASMSLWKNFKLDDIQSMLAHPQRQLLFFDVSEPATNVVTFLLFWALVSQRSDVTQLIITQYINAVDYKTLRTERIARKSIPRALSALLQSK